MSFDDWGGSGGGGGGSSGGYGYQRSGAGRDGDNQYIRLSQLVKKNITTITQNVAKLQKMSNYIGTQRDVPEMHHQMTDILESTRVLIRDTNGNIKQLGNLDGGTPQESRKRRMEQEKLSQDFQAVLRSFQSCQRVTINKERESVRTQRAHSIGRGGGGGHDGYDEDASLIDENRRQEAHMMDAQVDDQSAFIEEREEGIKQLESTMLEVNDIFKDLGNIVTEQGEMLDNIEYNMTATSTHVENGTEQLGKASRYQKKARKKMMCLLVIVVVVAAVLTIILVTTLHKSSSSSTTPATPLNDPLTTLASISNSPP